MGKVQGLFIGDPSYYWEEGEVIEDEVLVDRILTGDAEAFRCLVERYAGTVYHAAYGVLQNGKDAEDAAQEAFMQIHLSLPRYGRLGLKTWINRIAVNKAIDRKRSLARKYEKQTELHEDDLPASENSTTLGVEAEVVRKERERMIRYRIERMPEGYRDVVVAYYFEEKSYRQIADDFGLEPKSVESKLYRAKQWLRKHWKEDDFT